MTWWGEDSGQYNSYQQATETPHEAEWSHELIAGAAAYEAAKSYENHRERNGDPEDHAKAKEILAGFAGAFVDREVETRGLDFIDKEKAKYQAQEQINQEYDNRYGGGY